MIKKIHRIAIDLCTYGFLLFWIYTIWDTTENLSLTLFVVFVLFRAVLLDLAWKVHQRQHELLKEYIDIMLVKR
jgi:hypothetical protein